MPDYVGLTYLAKSRYPTTYTLQVPGTEKKNEDGSVRPGTGATFTFVRGKFHPRVPYALAERLLNGPEGMLKYAVVEGTAYYDRAFVEGNRAPKTETQDVSDQVKALNDKTEELKKLIEALAAAGGIDKSALAALGVSSDADDEQFDEVIDGSPVENPSKHFTLTDGSFQRSADGALLCPHCEAWSTQPISPEYTEGRARKALGMHIRKAHKDAGEDAANASETDESE